VVAWSSDGSAGSDADAQSIQVRRYDAAGVPLAAEFQVNEYTTGGQASASVAVDGTGGFVVVWTSNQGDGTDPSGSVRGRRFDATGAPLGGDFQVNTYVTGSQYAADVAAAADGSFVVVWTSESSATDASAASVHGQRYDATGSADGAEFQVNTYTTNYQVQPAVGMTGSGSFVVAWQSNGGTGPDISSYSIHAQRFDAAGSPSGPEFQVNSYGTGAQVDPVIAPIGASGDFVVAWNSTGSAGSDTGTDSIQARRFDATGTPDGDDFQVNAYFTSQQASPVVAADGTGGFVVAWSSDGSPGSDASGPSVQAQRYAVARTILGKNILVKNPTGDEERRTVIVFAKENPTDIGPFLGDPVADGATLRLITKGTTDSDQTYLLNAAGWTALGSTGWKYSGPTGGDGDPVKKVLLKQTPGGTALLKVILKGSVGTQNLAVLPPNTADEGGLILDLHGGVTLCAAYGGAAGGTEVKDENRMWKLKNPTADGCPTP